MVLNKLLGGAQRLLSSHLTLLCFLTFSPLTARAQTVDRYYQTVQTALGNGAYEQLLAQYQADPLIRENIESGLIEELEKIKALPQEERVKAFKSVFQLGLSSSDSPLKYERVLNTTIENLANGSYDSRRVANVLLNRTVEYELDAVVTMGFDAERAIMHHHPNQKILFLGADFSGIFLRAARRGLIPRKRLIYTSGPQSIRDMLLGGDFTGVRNYFAALGLTPQDFLSDGVVIFDPSPSGSSTRLLLKAYLSSLSVAEQNQLLSKVTVRNFGSSSKNAVNYRDQVSKAEMKMSAAEIDELLKAPMDVSTIDCQSSMNSLSFSSQLKISELLTYKPKSVSPDSGAGLDKTPTLASARLRFLLGLVGDMTSYNSALGPRRRLNLPWMSEIDLAASKGRKAIEKFEDTGPVGLEKEFDNVKIVPTGDKDFPWEMIVDGKPVRLLSKLLGEGNNVKVYLTDRNTAIKIVKRPADARKQLMLAWANNLMNDYGMDAAKVFEVHPMGIYLEMEYVSGDSVEKRWGNDMAKMPEAIRSQILDHFRKARKLAMERGVWLDFKAANYHVNEAGRLVNVDYVPRTNSTFYRFFHADDGTPFTEEKALEMFMRYDLKKIEEATRKEQERLALMERQRQFEEDMKKQREKERLEREADRIAREKAEALKENIYASAKEEEIVVTSKSGKSKSKKKKRDEENQKCNSLVSRIEVGLFD